MIGRVIHLLGLTTLVAQVVGGLGAFGFYAHLVVKLTSGKEQLGLAGLAVAGYTMAMAVCLAFAAVSAAVLVLAARRIRFWRIAAPIPALAATVGLGIWLFSGDPGDEQWLQIAFAVEASALAIAIVAALFTPGELRSSTE